MSTRATEPHWLETPAGAVFCWHHAPTGAERDAAVVLCKPFGYDAACSHRAYRHLAERLAAKGFHVLRVDYHGTGDSSGGDADPDRLAAWVGSVHAASSWLRANVDAQKIVFFGTRLGALVALQAAAGDDVDALVLFAPPVSGRVWLREMRAFQALRDTQGREGLGARAGGLEVVGFLLAAPTTEGLNSLDPFAGPRLAPAALVIARDDLPGSEERFAAKLEARGVMVTRSTTRGYAAMMQDDPNKSVVPGAVWNEIGEWLAKRYPDLKPAPQPAPPGPRVAMVIEHEGAPPVREEAVHVDGLFGVLTEPVNASAALPAVILHNVGANAHVGSNRMYVTMARRWAAHGFRVVRYDSAGLGDSPANARVAENTVYSSNAIDDSQQVMDFLSRTGRAQRFVLMGLCSGAYVSFHAAVADSRVVGIVLMNIMIFHWKEGDPIDVRKRDMVKFTRFYWRALFEKESLSRLLRGDVRVNAIAQGLTMKAWSRARASLRRVLAGESDIARGFRALLDRGADVLLVFAAEDGGRDLVDEHLGTDGERFHRERGFRFEVMDDTDHTFSPLWSQEALLSLLTSHLLSRFVPRSLPPPPAHDIFAVRVG
jgi:alpha-beta hydrolase superfamily lysophospholipase